MANQILTVEDLMQATYQGRYAEIFFNVIRDRGGIGPGVKGAFGSGPNEGLGHELKELAKADDNFTTGDSSYFNPIYGASTFDWLNFESDIWRLLRKTTYAALGDSFRVVDAEAVNFHGQAELATALGDTDIPDVTEVTVTDPAVMYNHWQSTFMAQIKSTWQDTPRKDASAFFREHHIKQHPSNINAKLAEDTDTPADGGGNFDVFIESIDRVCSDAAESALLSAATDNDIYGFDRSAGEAEAYVDLNGGVLRDLDLGLIDDMLADIKKFSTNRNFIMITDEVQLNTVEALAGVKHRYDSGTQWKISPVNGVNTREGIKAGLSVSTYVGAGIEVPIFASKDIHAESGGNGNIYCLDMDSIEIRVALPTVYYTTDNPAFLLLDSFNYKYMLLTVAQLVATQFNNMGAVKYLN